MKPKWTVFKERIYNKLLEAKAGGRKILSTLGNEAKNIPKAVFDILILENRVEKEVADNFLGSLAAFIVSACIGTIIRLFFIPKPPWIGPSAQSIALLGGLAGLSIALISWQECYGWLLPKNKSEKEPVQGKSPYMLFFPSMLILLLGTTMILVIPLAFLSALSFSYGIPTNLNNIVLSRNFILLFYWIFLIHRILLLVQKSVYLLIQKYKKNRSPPHSIISRIRKYILIIGVVVTILILNTQEWFKPFSVSAIPTLLLWSFLIMGPWEKADRREISWQRASSYWLDAT